VPTLWIGADGDVGVTIPRAELEAGDVCVVWMDASAESARVIRLGSVRRWVLRRRGRLAPPRVVVLGGGDPEAVFRVEA
jgi:hypothetical protein